MNRIASERKESNEQKSEIERVQRKERTNDLIEGQPKGKILSELFGNISVDMNNNAKNDHREAFGMTTAVNCMTRQVRQMCECAQPIR
jgi:hypothetical protein